MNGHQQILSLRAQGFKPAAVFIEDRISTRAEWEIRFGELPAVYVGGDNPALADLRFAADCRVHLWADDPVRAVAWVDRLLQDGVQHVIQATQGEVYEWHR